MSEIPLPCVITKEELYQYPNSIVTFPPFTSVVRLRHIIETAHSIITDPIGKITKIYGTSVDELIIGFTSEGLYDPCKTDKEIFDEVEEYAFQIAKKRL